MSKEVIYLDYAAATPLDERVFLAMQPYLQDNFYNPSAAYQPAREVRKDITEARTKIAHLLGAKPNEIIFTAGASESIHLAFAGVLTASTHAVVSIVEHVAVLEAAKQFDHTIVEVDHRTARINSEALGSAILDNTVLISIGLVNNELGTIQDIKAISALVAAIRQKRQQAGNSMPLYLHSDASQAAGIVDLHVSRLGVDLLTLNGAKIYGPKQMGLLYYHHNIPLRPILPGGGQEQNLRAGTENVAGIIGLCKALSLAEDQRKAFGYRVRDLKKLFIQAIISAIPDTVELASSRHQAPHIFTLAWPGIDAERLLYALENMHVLVATGSACAANKQTGSHVLAALGIDTATVNSSLRFSLGRDTSQDQLTRAAKIITDVITQERAR